MTYSAELCQDDSVRYGQSQEGLMPEVVFYALGGRSIEQKRALIKDFTDAVVKNY